MDLVENDDMKLIQKPPDDSNDPLDVWVFRAKDGRTLAVTREVVDSAYSAGLFDAEKENDETPT